MGNFGRREFKFNLDRVSIIYWVFKKTAVFKNLSYVENVNSERAVVIFSNKEDSQKQLRQLFGDDLRLSLSSVATGGRSSSKYRKPFFAKRIEMFSLEVTNKFRTYEGSQDSEKKFAEHCC